jgi:hypothetical protein
MKKYVLCGAIALACASALTLATPTAEDGIQTPPAPPTQSSAQTPPPKQTPPTTPPQTPTAQRPATDPQGGTQTLVGCLYRERDVPGRTPNIAEKAGVLEDYILADASVGTTGKAPATGKLFKVEKIADDQLKAHVGKRVEVTGRMDPGGSAPPAARMPPTGGAPPTTGTPPPPKPDTGLGQDKIEIPEFEAVSIKEVPGSCPSKPAGQ